MLEVLLDEVDNLVYWPDRNPNIYEYKQNGILRIDFVHMPLIPRSSYDNRRRLIIQRANNLLSLGISVIEVGLYDQLGGILGENIVVGGAIEGECVLDRAKFLKQQGAKKAIIDLALTVDY